MKKLWIFSAVFLLAGVIMLLVPIHMAAHRRGAAAVGDGHGHFHPALAESHQEKTDRHSNHCRGGVCGSCDTDGGNGNPYIQWPI